MDSDLEKKEKSFLLGIVVRGILAFYGFAFAVVVEAWA